MASFGREPIMTASAQAVTPATTSGQCGDRVLAVRLRVPLFRARCRSLTPPIRGSLPRFPSPWTGCSTLITSAPISMRRWDASGPDMCVEKSTIRSGLSDSMVIQLLPGLNLRAAKQSLFEPLTPCDGVALPTSPQFLHRPELWYRSQMKRRHWQGKQ